MLNGTEELNKLSDISGYNTDAWYPNGKSTEELIEATKNSFFLCKEVVDDIVGLLNKDTELRSRINEQCELGPENVWKNPDSTNRQPRPYIFMGDCSSMHISLRLYDDGFKVAFFCDRPSPNRRNWEIDLSDEYTKKFKEICDKYREKQLRHLEELRDNEIQKYNEHKENEERLAKERKEFIDNKLKEQNLTKQEVLDACNKKKCRSCYSSFPWTDESQMICYLKGCKGYDYYGGD